MPMVDQSLKEKGRNGDGYAGKNREKVQRQPDCTINSLDYKDLRRAENLTGRNAATDHDV